MATLVAIGYPDQTTADEARETVRGLERELIIQADQVASISRDIEGKYHVSTTHGGASAGGGAVGRVRGCCLDCCSGSIRRVRGGCWTWSPVRSLGEKGIDKEFQKQVRDYLKPGTSALFMVIEQATPDKAVAALEQYGGTSSRRRSPRKTRRSSRSPAGTVRGKALVASGL